MYGLTEDTARIKCAGLTARNDGNRVNVIDYLRSIQ